MFYYRDEDGNYIGAFDTEQEWLTPCHPPEDGRQKWDNESEAWLPLEVPEPVIEVDAIDLWRRADENEAKMIEAAMASQSSARLRNIFAKAQTYKSDDELWPVLEQTAAALFGEERAAVLLAPSSRS